MRALLLFFFLLPSLLFSALIVLNLYNHEGYLISKGEFDEFSFVGSCDSFFNVFSFIYIPPDEDINRLLSFPAEPVAVFDTGLTVSSTGIADTIIPDRIFETLKEGRVKKVFCIDIPAKFESSRKIKILEDTTLLSVGSVVGAILKESGIPYEVNPSHRKLKKGQILDLTPKPPVVRLNYIKLDGLGSFVFADITDSSTVTIQWQVDGKIMDYPESFLLEPGTHTVLLKVKDVYGETAQSSLVVFSEPFEIFNEKFTVEIGYPAEEKIKRIFPKELLSKPGIYEYKDYKPYGFYMYTLVATDTILPKMSFTINDGIVTVNATDVNGVTVNVFINGILTRKLHSGINDVVILVCDGFGNTVIKAFSVPSEPEIFRFTKRFFLGRIYDTDFIKKIGGRNGKR